MSELPTIYLQKFWPSPKEPARVQIELSLEQDAKHVARFDFYGQVSLPDGSFRGIGGTVEADDKTDAERQVAIKMIELLGTMLADATEKMKRR